MTDVRDDLEADLVEAARRLARARRTALSVRRRRLGGVPPALLAAGVVALGASAAAAGTLTVLRGSPIPAPRAVDAGPTLTPLPGSAVVSALRSPDPGGKAAAPWTVRTARAGDGLLCTTAGQVVDGDFGIVGLDGRFRPLAEGVVDGCGQARAGASAVVGARVFDAPDRRAVRTVLDGVAGKDLEGVTATIRGRGVRVPVRDGAFALVLAGYPEDVGLRVRLRFAGGRTEDHALGADRFVVPDPLTGPAWRAQSGVFGAAPGHKPYPGTCVTFAPARPRPDAPRSAAACGRLAGDLRHPTGWFFAVRRLDPRQCAGGRFGARFGTGRWCGGPPRTALWGLTGQDVRRVVVSGAPGGDVVAGRVAVNGTTLAVLPAADPARLRVTLELTDGRRVRLPARDTDLIDPPQER